MQVLELDAAEEAAFDRAFAERNAVRGLPSLPPLTPDSPLDSLLFADRVPHTPPVEAGAEGDGPIMRTVVLPQSVTGTAYQELFKYQEPAGYDAQGDPVPMVIAYHGFGASASSVATASTIDEECNARGWFYVAPTGLDDKLFASPISQQHVDEVIEYMLTTFNIDADRLYMVGFSMGGGYVTNYAARHRDPEGVMIAGVGTVSAALDWVMVYSTSGQNVQAFMEVPENFGGNPLNAGFKYQQASALHFNSMTYPPLPGVLVESFSMARNNLHVPAYQTWDQGDLVTTIVEVNDVLGQLHDELGPPVTQSVVSGTVDGMGAPAPHSWLVLDETALFDFFEPLSVDRNPPAFRAMLDASGRVSWIHATRRSMLTFARFEAEADDVTRRLAVTEIAGTNALELDAGVAGLTGTDPVRLDLELTEPITLSVTLHGFATRPSYLLHADTGELVAGVDTVLADDALRFELTGPATLSADIVQDPDWSADLDSTPNPVAPGGVATVAIDGPAGSEALVLIVAFEEQLYTAKGVKLGALAAAPAKIKVFNNVGPEGDLSLPAPIPDEPSLSGLRLVLQAVGLAGGNQVLGVTNLWGVDIE